MDKTKLIDDLIAAGAKDDEIVAAVQLAEEKETQAIPATTPEPEPVGGIMHPVAAVKGMGKDWAKNWQEAGANISQRARSAEEAKNIPEYLLREAGGAVGGLTDIGMAGLKTLGSVLNRASGGAMEPAAAMTSKITSGMFSNPALEKVGGDISRTGIGKDIYGAMQDPRIKTNVGAAANVASVLPVGKILAPFISGATKGGISAITKGTEAVISKAPEVIAKGINKGTGRLASELSGVSEEALRKYGTGTGAGAKELAAASGTQSQIGNELVSKIRDWDSYIPENTAIQNAIPKMPAVRVENLVNTLEGAKLQNAKLAESKAINAKIDEKIAEIKSASSSKDIYGTIPASEALALRKEFDNIVEDYFGKEANSYISALKKGRHTIAGDLVTAAETSGNPEYVSAMKSLATKMQKVDELKQWIGKNAATQDSRSQQFISTLFGKNKAQRQKAIQDITDIFGGDFYDRAKMASLAQELGEGGKAGWIPQQTTGKSALGTLGTIGALVATHGNPLAVAPIALSSPKIAAATLAGTQGLENIGKAVGKAATTPIKNPFSKINKGMFGNEGGAVGVIEKPSMSIAAGLKQYQNNVAFRLVDPIKETKKSVKELLEIKKYWTPIDKFKYDVYNKYLKNESGSVGTKSAHLQAEWDKSLGKPISPAMEAYYRQPKTIQQMRTTLESLAPAQRSEMITRLREIYGNDWKSYAPLFGTLAAGLVVPAGALTASAFANREKK